MGRRLLFAIFENGGRTLKKFARLACLASAISIGCKPPTSDEQLDNVRSWLATADMVAQGWLNHTTPEKYTRQTLELAHKTIRKTADDLRKAPPAGIDSASLDSLLTQGGNRVERMEGQVASRNAPEVRTDLVSLRSEEKAVQVIAERLKSAR